METYDLKSLQELLKDIHVLTKIKLCIYDGNENELCFYPKQFSDFCSELRRIPEMNQRCQECDRRAFSECKKNRSQHLYTCHAGLMECISPILLGEKLIGYIVLGQIKSSENADFSLIEDKFPQSCRDSLKKKFEQLPCTDMEMLRSAIRVLDACAGYEYLKKAIHTDQNTIDSLVDTYINEHLTENLSVPILCSKFQLSHCEIYSIFKEYFHSTPAEYVKQCRLNKARTLLKEGMPVNKIARLCGIPDYNYFSKLFKKKFGISPREYRKSLHQGYRK